MASGSASLSASTSASRRAAVAGSHAAQVAVELAAAQEVGERVLFDPGGAAVGEQLLMADGRQ